MLSHSPFVALHSFVADSSSRSAGLRLGCSKKSVVDSSRIFEDSRTTERFCRLQVNQFGSGSNFGISVNETLNRSKYFLRKLFDFP